MNEPVNITRLSAGNGSSSGHDGTKRTFEMSRMSSGERTGSIESERSTQFKPADEEGLLAKDGCE